MARARHSASRRAVCLGGAVALCHPTQSVHAAVLTASAALTAGPYLNDVKAARRGLDEVKPLLELEEARGYEAVRVAIRKPPVSGIRKACSKVLQLLPEKSEALKEKTKIYDAIKKDLEAIDNGCRPDVEKRPDLPALLARLQTELDAFGEGLAVN